MKLSVLSELGHPVSYYAKIGRVVGGANAGILLCQLMYWSGSIDGNFKGRDPEGWVYKSQEDIENETALTRYEQEGARKRLRKLGVLEEKKDTRPSDWRQVLWFRVKTDAFDKLFSIFEAKSLDGEKPHPRVGKNHIQGRGKPTSKDVENPQTTTETTPEITTDNTPGKKEKEKEKETEVGKSFLENEKTLSTAIAVERSLSDYRDTSPELFTLLHSPASTSAALINEQVHLHGLRMTHVTKQKTTVEEDVARWFLKRYEDPKNPSYALADVQYIELCTGLNLEPRRTADQFAGRQAFNSNLRQLFFDLASVGASPRDYKKWLSKRRRLSVQDSVSSGMRQGFCSEFGAVIV